VKAWVPLLALSLALSPLAVVHPLRVSGASMEPTLRDASPRWALRSWVAGAPQRGEVWLVAGPDGPSVKRVVGLPGDTLEQVGGELRLGGRRLEEPFVTSGEQGDGGPWVCGEGYLVAGDNRPRSRDGRAWGPLPRAAFRSRILGVGADPSR
jgi:signal peptidase I